MALYRSAANIPVGTVDMQTTSFSTTLVHGEFASLMVAERPAGYHSRPHAHDCEQLNLLASGELHVYCDERVFRLRPGDALRIPVNAVHWSWNRADGPCTLIEVHAPGLQDDPEFRHIAVCLADDDEEDRVAASGPVNVFVELSDAEIARIEQTAPEPGSGAQQEPSL